jgi:D-amino-acid oxidase
LRGVIQGTPVRVVFKGTDVSYLATHYKNIIIHSGEYTADLHKKAAIKGVRFVEKSFRSARDVEALPEPIIFNCTGNGMPHIFYDPNVYPSRGQLIQFTAQPGVNYYITKKWHDDPIFLGLYPWSDRFFIGNIVEQGEGWLEVVPETVAAILVRARAFFGGVARPRL